MIYLREADPPCKHLGHPDQGDYREMHNQMNVEHVRTGARLLHSSPSDQYRTCDSESSQAGLKYVQVIFVFCVIFFSKSIRP